MLRLRLLLKHLDIFLAVVDYSFRLLAKSLSTSSLIFIPCMSVMPFIIA